jgi:hypothetical protein
MRANSSLLFSTSIVSPRTHGLSNSPARRTLAATQTSFRLSVDGMVEPDASVAAALCAVPTNLRPQLFPAGYSGKPGDLLRPLAIVGVVDLKAIELHCPWPTANTGFRLTFVIASLLSASFFGVTLASGSNKTFSFKWFLRVMVVLLIFSCGIDSRSVNYVAKRLIPNGSYIDLEFSMSGRFIGVCALDILCALQAVQFSLNSARFMWCFLRVSMHRAMYSFRFRSSIPVISCVVTPACFFCFAACHQTAGLAAISCQLLGGQQSRVCKCDLAVARARRLCGADGRIRAAARSDMIFIQKQKCSALICSSRPLENPGLPLLYILAPESRLNAHRQFFIEFIIQICTAQRLNRASPPTRAASCDRKRE